LGARRALDTDCVLQLSSENRPSLYLPRLLAFGLIIVGIVDKNRSGR
jgi:hypothetical protein